MPTITLMTDFGNRDAYVAAMKGVILQIAPAATLVDISHEIEPQGVVTGAVVWRQAVPWFPTGTIHLAVVDPGVGSRRRVLAAKIGGHILLAPDNGLMTLLLQDFPLEELHVIDNRRFMLQPVSSTFHGRDILAPVAAHLAAGIPMRDLGPPTDRAELLQLPKPEIVNGTRIKGAILYADRWGNLITNITRQHILAIARNRPELTVSVKGQSIGPMHSTYSDVAAGQCLALIGSSDHLEVAVNGGSAMERFGSVANGEVVVE